jgi:hypothetical protein
MVVQSEDYSCKVSGSSTGADRFLTSSVRVLKSSTKADHLFPVRSGDMVTVSARAGSPGAARSLWKDADLDIATQINLMLALLWFDSRACVRGQGARQRPCVMQSTLPLALDPFFSAVKRNPSCASTRTGVPFTT